MENTLPNSNSSHTYDGVQITLSNCGETFPANIIIPGHLRIGAGCKRFVFSRAEKVRRSANPLLFRGKYLNCRIKKNGNYQITCPVAKDVIAKFTSAEGKVNLTEVFRYQTAELQRIMIAIEKASAPRQKDNIVVNSNN